MNRTPSLTSRKFCRQIVLVFALVGAMAFIILPKLSEASIRPLNNLASFQSRDLNTDSLSIHRPIVYGAMTKIEDHSKSVEVRGFQVGIIDIIKNSGISYKF